MKTYDERVPHAGEDLKRVDLARLNIDRIGLNDGHRVTLDLERVVRVAGQADEAEAVTLALLNGDHAQRSVRVASGLTTETVDESRVSPGRETRALTRKDVRPVRQGDDGGLCDA